MKKRIIEMIEKICALETIEESTLLIEMGVLDSLAIINLIENLEKDFNIVIKDEDIIAENFMTVETIEKLLTNYVT